MVNIVFWQVRPSVWNWNMKLELHIVHAYHKQVGYSGSKSVNNKKLRVYYYILIAIYILFI